MTLEQFNTLREWLTRRAAILAQLRDNARDVPRCRRLRSDLVDVDLEAAWQLVEPPYSVTRGQLEQLDEAARIADGEDEE